MTMLGRLLNLGCALILASGALAAQELQITPANRTIYVTAEDEVTLEPAVAIINFGYQTFGPNQQAAMNDLSQKSKAITKTLVDAGIDPKAIESSTLRRLRAPLTSIPRRRRKCASNTSLRRGRIGGYG